MCAGALGSCCASLVGDGGVRTDALCGCRQISILGAREIHQYDEALSRAYCSVRWVYWPRWRRCDLRRGLAGNNVAGIGFERADEAPLGTEGITKWRKRSAFVAVWQASGGN